MQVLIIGNGGREHALAWKVAQSHRVTRIFVAPGNGGTAGMANVENVPIPAGDLDGLLAFAQAQAIELTLVGPEVPLVEGVVDRFQAAGLVIFGPTQVAAQLEGSKAFSKEFMQRHAIPTGAAGIFDNFDQAVRFLRQFDTPPVIKASGLAAGKGVILPDSKERAAMALQDMLLDGRFGPAGSTVLIEERLSGPEISVLAFCDGKTFALMPTAQDHKRLMDGDQGPNTGGMGAFAPSPLATPELLEQIGRTVIQPTLAGIRAEGTPYVGVLYAGIILTADGPKVLEFNCRFGDPETQALLPLLQSDLVEITLACVQGRLGELEIRWHTGAGATVVMAAGGYPGDYTRGVEIRGVEEAAQSGHIIFHAGTKVGEDGRLLTDGGRVLASSAVGDTLEQALTQAYLGVAHIHFNEAHYRQDIGRLGT